MGDVIHYEVTFAQKPDGAFVSFHDYELLRQQLEAEREKVAAWQDASQCGHPNPCTLGPLCPYCEIARQKTRAEAAEAGERALLELIERAPHAADCASVGYTYQQQINENCDCWKAEALKEQTNG